MIRLTTVWKVWPTNGLNMKMTDTSSDMSHSNTLAVTLSISCRANEPGLSTLRAEQCERSLSSSTRLPDDKVVVPR